MTVLHCFVLAESGDENISGDYLFDEKLTENKLRRNYHLFH